MGMAISIPRFAQKVQVHLVKEVGASLTSNSIPPQ